MTRRLFFSTMTGALFAAPQTRLAEPQVDGERLKWFSLTESFKDIEDRIGPPTVVGDFPADYRFWQYRFGGVDEHDFSHYLVFRRSTGRLISITRAWDPEQKVDALFPAAETEVIYATTANGSRYGARVRRLSGESVLIAMGSTAPGQPTSQLTLIRNSELNHFFPWLAAPTGHLSDKEQSWPAR